MLHPEFDSKQRVLSNTLNSNGIPDRPGSKRRTSSRQRIPVEQSANRMLELAIEDNIARGRPGQLKVLVGQASDEYLTRPRPKGQHPLHMAACRSAKTLEPLLQVVEDRGLLSLLIDVRDQFGRTPLWLSVENCRVESVALLLSKGADVNVTSDGEITLLHVLAAVEMPSFSIADLLVLHGLDVRAVNSRGEAAVDLFIKRRLAGDPSVTLRFVTALLFKGAPFPNKTLSPEHQFQLIQEAAAGFNTQWDFEQLLPLVSKNVLALRNSDGEYLPHMIVRSRSPRCLVALLNRGVDSSVVNKEGKQPFLLFRSRWRRPATFDHYLESLRDLVEAGLFFQRSVFINPYERVILDRFLNRLDKEVEDSLGKIFGEGGLVKLVCQYVEPRRRKRRRPWEDFVHDAADHN